MSDINLWKEFVEEGNILYNYMICNFNNMIDENTIKHFNVGYGRYSVMHYIDDINDKYNQDIQLELIPWIKKQGKDLFEYNNWIPFRDQYAMVDMFLGYRKMFIYKQYVFQLSLISECDYFDVCNNCKNGNSIHFIASFYGSKDNDNRIQPDDIFTLSEDNIMPDSYWYRDRNYCTGS